MVRTPGEEPLPESERDAWNRRFAEGSHGPLEADPLLVNAYQDYIQPLLGEGHSKRALDLAGGTGRHTLYLAERGWQTTLIDVSDVGAQKARQHAAERGLALEVRNEDLRFAELGTESYELVLVFFYLQRELFPALLRALAPGGILVYKTYTSEHPRLSGGRGPSHPMHLLQSNELLHAFRELRVLHYRETVTNKGVAELVAQKR